MSSKDLEPNEKTIIFHSCDNESISVSFSEAKISNLVKNIIEDSEDDEINIDSDDNGTYNKTHSKHETLSPGDASDSVQINLPNVNIDSLRKIVEFMKHYYIEPLESISYPFEGSTLTDIITQEWYIGFINSFESKMLFKLIDGSNYMDIEPLFNLGCLVVSTMIMNKTPEEIGTMLKIDKLTAEEEMRAREEHEWMFS